MSEGNMGRIQPDSEVVAPIGESKEVSHSTPAPRQEQRVFGKIKEFARRKFNGFPRLESLNTSLAIPELSIDSTPEEIFRHAELATDTLQKYGKKDATTIYPLSGEERKSMFLELQSLQNKESVSFDDFDNLASKLLVLEGGTHDPGDDISGIEERSLPIFLHNGLWMVVERNPNFPEENSMVSFHIADGEPAGRSQGNTVDETIVIFKEQEDDFSDTYYYSGKPEKDEAEIIQIIGENIPRSEFPQEDEADIRTLITGENIPRSVLEQEGEREAFEHPLTKEQSKAAFKNILTMYLIMQSSS